MKSSKGYLYMIFSAFCGAAGANCYKGLNLSFSPEMVNLLSRVFPLLMLIPAAFHARGREFRTSQFGLMFVMSLFYFLSIFTYIISLKYIPVVSASLLFNCAPIWTPFIALAWLKEEIDKFVWIGIGISFIGVIFVLQPGFAMFHPIALLAMLSGFLMAVAFVATRKLSEKDSHHKIVFYTMVLSTVFALVPPLFTGGYSWPVPWKESVWPITLFVISGIMAYGFQFFRAKAVSLVKAAKVMPFSFTGPVFAGILGWFFFDNLPNLLFVIGAIIVIGGMTLILRAK